MISSLWIAKTGLDAQQTNMDVIANNLANVSTNGFKRQRAVFEDLLYQTIRQPGAQSSEQTTLPSGLQIGTGVRPVATERLHSQGNLSQTNNSKDVAIKGSRILLIFFVCKFLACKSLCKNLFNLCFCSGLVHYIFKSMVCNITSLGSKVIKSYSESFLESCKRINLNTTNF